MAYSDFKDLSELEDYNIKYTIDSLFTDEMNSIIPSPAFLDTLSIAMDLPTEISEKARSENYITPVLFEAYRQSSRSFSIFSGYSLNIDSKLSGICDYIISKERKTLTLQAPILCIVEAKQRTIIEGLAQAGAEMIASVKYNETRNKEIKTLWGCVTTGIEWRFLKLENNLLTIDKNTYFLDSNNMPKLLGVLNTILTIN